MPLADLLSGARWVRLMDRAEPWITFGIALLVLLAVRHFVFRWAGARARGNRYGPAAVDAFRFPSMLWVLAGALLVALRYADLTERQIVLANDSVRIFVIVSLSLVAAALAVRIVTIYGERKNLPFAVAGLSRTLTYIVVLSVGGLTLLRVFDISITPMLTALGVGGLAVALALQDTLANFFAGVHILIENPMSLGDFIRLSTGEEGTVTDIGWRTTRLKTPSNSIVVVPNVKITSGILTNFNLPETRTATEVTIVAALEADLDQVRRIALEETPLAEGVLPEPPPLFLCDPGVTPTHLQVKIVFHVGNRLAQGLAQSAVRCRLIARFRAENVPLPRPDRLAVRV